MEENQVKYIFDYLIVVLIIICFILAYIYQNIKFMELKMKYEKSRDQYVKALELYMQKKYDYYKIISLKNVEKFALSNGMKSFNRKQIIEVIDKGK